jgi:hypothetical protein
LDALANMVTAGSSKDPRVPRWARVAWIAFRVILLIAGPGAIIYRIVD